MVKIPIKSPAEIAVMRESCRIAALILQSVADIIKPGITTEDIDVFVALQMKQFGAVASTLNYKGYPKSCCTSPNEVICHGIPSKEVILTSGDIINVDVTAYKNGFHGDSSRMYFVGGRSACSSEASELVDVTHAAMEAGIAVVRPGAKVGDIGAAIKDYIQSTGKRYGIVREYTGHGVGRDFHESPQIVHVGRKGYGEELKAGMTFTIEPMINIGGAATRLSKSDGWTVTTADGSLSAQWEHTILVTPTGVETLTVL